MTPPKRLLTIILSLAVACVVTQCAPAGQYRIEVVSKGFQHDFWRQVKRGCLEAGKEFGADVNFVGPDNESDVAGQIELLANAIEKAPDAICIAPLHPEATLQTVFAVADAGIPVIAFDSDMGPDAGDDVLALVATDNKAAGAVAAQRMYDRLEDAIAGAGPPVRIGVLSQDTTSRSVGDRTFGFIERMEQLCGSDNTAIEGSLLYEKKVPGARVVLDVGIPEETVDAAMDAVVRRVFGRSNLIGAYGSNEFAAKSMVNVNEDLGILGPDGVVGIGFDSGAIQVRAVRDRVLYGSITQNPFMIGYFTVKTAVEAARGLPVEDTAVPFFFYTADNMDDPEIAACLYE